RPGWHEKQFTRGVSFQWHRGVNFEWHTTGMPPPKPVVELVERFERDRKVCLCVPCPRSRRAARRQVFLSPDYKEEQLRAEFLNPFFESLCWNVSNRAGLTEVSESVNYEESVKSRGDDSVAVPASRRGRTPPLAGPRTPKPSLILLTSMLISC
ncbi:hypothetical protein JXD38_07050, partial [candidate division WOR-3 bacterium]|nr:hypothetical protein [candidate division WOR-3 bacterium]